MNFDIEKSGDASIVNFNGRLTDKCLENIRSILTMLMNNSSHVVLNFDEVTEVDPVCLQLICMAARTSKNLQKTMILRGDYLNVIRTNILENGRECLKRCTPSNHNRCLLVQMNGEENDRLQETLSGIH